jgi:hypothetical protein
MPSVEATGGGMMWPSPNLVNRTDRKRKQDSATIDKNYNGLEQTLGVQLVRKINRQESTSSHRRAVFDNPHLIKDITTAAEVMSRHPTLKLLPDGETAVNFESVKDVTVADQAAKMRRLENLAISQALYHEQRWFKRREILLARTKAALYAMVVLLAILFASSWWFSGLWNATALVLAIGFLPHYTRIGGCMVDMSRWDQAYALVGGIVSIPLMMTMFGLVGVELVRLSKACDPAYVGTDLVEEVVEMTKTECLIANNKLGPAADVESRLNCENEDLYPAVLTETVVSLADELAGALTDVASTVSSSFDLDADVGKCNVERVLLNVGLVANVILLISLIVLYWMMFVNFKHRAGDLIEAALIHAEPAVALIAKALDGTPDVARAASLKIGALLAGATDQVEFEDGRPNEFVDQTLLDEFREAHVGSMLCKLMHSDDSVVRMHAAETVVVFVLDPTCMESFAQGTTNDQEGKVGESGLSCLLALINRSTAVQADIDKDYTLEQTSGLALTALSHMCAGLPDVAEELFEDTQALSQIARGVARGAFAPEAGFMLTEIFYNLLIDAHTADETRRKTGAHEAVCEVLTALLQSDSTEQLLHVMTCVRFMYDEARTSAIKRSYMRSILAMRQGLDLSVKKLVAEMLLIAASSPDQYKAVAEYLISFDGVLVAVLRELVDSAVTELVRTAVLVVHELTRCDTHMSHMRTPLEKLLDDALLADTGDADVKRAVTDAKTMLRAQGMSDK